MCFVTQPWPTLYDPWDWSPPGSSVHWDSPGKNTAVGCHALPPGDLPNWGIEPWLPALQADFLPPEPPGQMTLLITKPVKTLKRKLESNVLHNHWYKDPLKYWLCCSVVKLCPALQPHGLQQPVFPVLCLLPECAQIHVHWVGEAI